MPVLDLLILPDLNILGLHGLHWLVAVLPAAALLLAALCLGLANQIVLRRLGRVIGRLTGQIDSLGGRRMNNLLQIAHFCQAAGNDAIRSGFERLIEDSRDLFQSSWLPDPSHALNAETLLRAGTRRRLGLMPAVWLGAVGLGCALAELIIQNVDAPPAGLAVALVLLPALAGLIGAAGVAAANASFRQRIQGLLLSLYRSLDRRLPVYSDQAGVALLIEDFHQYDRDMKDTLRTFTATAGRLAESDMAEGIRRSVEQVLLDSVAPSIKQASAALAALAGELASRQERGMQDLAVRFASALTTEMTNSLQPVTREIMQMGSLMADVRNYIEYAMRALETVRQQSEGQLSDTREAVRALSEARSQMTADFGGVDQRLQKLAEVSGELATFYEGNAQGLNQNLQRLGEQIDEYGRNLAAIIVEATQSVREVRQGADAQQESTGQYLAAMQDQVSLLTSQLNVEIGGLLGEMNTEAATIAGHTGEIGNRLDSLNRTLSQSIDQFSQSSAQYVRQTLASLDGNLADLASRIAHTAAELRDAVDALPQVFSQTIPTVIASANAAAIAAANGTKVD
jgi:hypothetical protein